MAPDDKIRIRWFAAGAALVLTVDLAFLVYTRWDAHQRAEAPAVAAERTPVAQPR